MFFKANYHFEYLKHTQPEKFKKYLNFLDTAKNRLFNEYAFLLLPVFKRNPKLENSASLVKLGQRIKLLCRLFYILVIGTLIYFLILVILFGD